MVRYEFIHEVNLMHFIATHLYGKPEGPRIASTKSDIQYVRLEAGNKI